MRILQLCGDWKWTGPAEPMLVLAGALRVRGHVVELACATPPSSAERGLADEARSRGFAPVLELPAGRGLRPLGDAPAARALRARLSRQPVDVVHTWHTRDHTLALRALGARGGRRSAALVRSLAAAGAAPVAPWSRWLLGPGCDGLVCVGRASARSHRDVRGARPTAACLGAVETERLSGSREKGRALLGLGEQAPVVAVVARVQRHRRFDLLFEAMTRLLRTHPQARLVVVGRGTHFDEVARRPVERLGLGDVVVLAGHRLDDYADVLRAADVLTYLVPGSDGTCRTVLEAAACGVPAVASRRGALPEIVADGESGLLVDEDPDALAAAWRRLFDDPSLRRALAAGARSRAETVFHPGRLADEVEALYTAARRRAAGGSGPAPAPG